MKFELRLAAVVTASFSRAFCGVIDFLHGGHRDYLSVSRPCPLVGDACRAPRGSPYDACSRATMWKRSLTNPAIQKMNGSRVEYLFHQPPCLCL